jgi:hypothetical protein
VERSLAGNKLNTFLLPEPIPVGLKQNHYHLEVLHPRHLEMDYHAVMGSKEFLRRWSNSDWPEDNFTLEGNLFDLEWHYQEYQEKIAFTYTILNPEKSKCLGCIYIRPISSIQFITLMETRLLKSYPFFCSYWVINEIRNSELDQVIFSDLKNWLRTIWNLPAIIFTNNKQIPEQDVIFLNNSLELFLILQDENRYQQWWRPIKG